MAIDNLIPVYQARNVIYMKRGALGIFVSEKKDETGTVAMTEDEKRNLREEFNENYGLDNSRFPYGLSDVLWISSAPTSAFRNYSLLKKH